jgi:hypothetical protein
VEIWLFLDKPTLNYAVNKHTVGLALWLFVRNSGCGLLLPELKSLHHYPNMFFEPKKPASLQGIQL